MRLHKKAKFSEPLAGTCGPLMAIPMTMVLDHSGRPSFLPPPPLPSPKFLLDAVPRTMVRPFHVLVAFPSASLLLPHPSPASRARDGVPVITHCRVVKYNGQDNDSVIYPTPFWPRRPRARFVSGVLAARFHAAFRDRSVPPPPPTPAHRHPARLN